MNILITSAGRRGYIIKFFKDALKEDGKVYAGNSSEYCPAFAYADETVVTPLIYSNHYIPFLLSYCRKNNIDVVISLFDIDLMILAENKEKFEKIGTKIIVSDTDVIKCCNDKWNTYLFCKKNNILTPKTFLTLEAAVDSLDDGEVTFPLVIKPRWGMGSLQIYSVDTLEELTVLYKKCKKDIFDTYLKYESTFDRENCVLIQEKITGQEYGIDIINDLNATYQQAIIKKKYYLRAGETDCAEVIENNDLKEFSYKIGKLMKHVGNLDVDLFYSKGKIYLLEMNARLGGGFPFSYFAGVDLPSAILKWVKNEELGEELKIKKYGEIVHKDIQFVNLTNFIGE